MSRILSSGCRFCFALGLMMQTVWLAGCQTQTKSVITGTDEVGAVTTPSVDAARAVSLQQRDDRRPGSTVEVRAMAGTVSHGPLYFEDPIEWTGSRDGRFAVTGEDQWNRLIGPPRFAVNAVLYPLRACLAPPWTITTSDGMPRDDNKPVVTPGRPQDPTDDSEN